ncbi:MAG TPA: 4Fe-4S binding protein [Erysipelotrichaceae bacterium]|nr:4Fe-4S binding protein [Erysipelotrichaceae bacterium]
MIFTQGFIVVEDKNLKIAILSGKGGTGKTLVAVNLASVSDRSMYVDCDVEEPNGHLFFKPQNIEKELVHVKIPVIDKDLCSGCRKCVDFCKFNALAFIEDKPYIFENICHSCGGCTLVCPEKAIKEKDVSIGEVRRGISENVSVHSGIMNTGIASGVPIIKRLLEKKNVDKGIPVFIDCPPGNSCIVMESIQDADYCILVAEPTIFGAHNLALVYDLVKLFKKPHGVVLNKNLKGDNPIEKFCLEKNIPILIDIPFDQELGELNSNAKIAVRENSKYKKMFAALLERLMKEVQT